MNKMERKEEKELEVKKKKALEKFLEDREFSPEEIYDLVDKCANFVTINRSGDVFIKGRLTVKEKIALIAIARFLGHRVINEKINSMVTIEEVAHYASTDESIARARLSDLARKDSLLRSIERGSYTVKSLVAAKKFIEHLEMKRIKKFSESEKDES